MNSTYLDILEKEFKEFQASTKSSLSELRKDQVSGFKHNNALERQENTMPVLTGNEKHSSDSMSSMGFQVPPVFPHSMPGHFQNVPFPHPPFPPFPPFPLFPLFPPHPPFQHVVSNAPLPLDQNQIMQNSLVSTQGLGLNSSSNQMPAKNVDIGSNAPILQKTPLQVEDFTKFIKIFIPFLRVYYHCEESVAYLYVLFQHLLLNIVQERYPQSNWAYKKEFDSNEFFILMLTHPEYLSNVQQTCSKTLNKFFKDNLELLNKFFHYVHASSSNAALVQNLKLIFTKKNIIIKPRFELAKATEGSLNMQEKEALLRKFKYHLKLTFDSFLLYIKGEIAHHSLLCVEEFVKNQQNAFNIVTTIHHNSSIFMEYYILMPDSYKNHIVTHAKSMVDEKEDIRAHKHSVKQQTNPTSYNKKHILKETFYDPIEPTES